MNTTKSVDPSIKIAEPVLIKQDSVQPKNQKIKAIAPAIFSSIALTFCYFLTQKKVSTNLAKVSLVSFAVSYLCVFAFFKWKDSKTLPKKNEPAPSTETTQEPIVKTEPADQERIKELHQLLKSRITNDPVSFLKVDAETTIQYVKEMIQLDPEGAFPYIEELLSRYLSHLNKEKETPFLEFRQNHFEKSTCLHNLIKEFGEKTLQKLKLEEQYKKMVKLKKQVNTAIDDLVLLEGQLKTILAERNLKLTNEENANMLLKDNLLNPILADITNTLNFEKFKNVELLLKEMVELDPEWSVTYLRPLLHSFGEFFVYCSMDLQEFTSDHQDVWEKVKANYQSLKLNEKIENTTTNKQLVKLYEDTLKLFDQVVKKRQKVRHMRFILKEFA